ncbi:MAG: DNA translocase FtsK [Candidatus Liptonbacteria bacterium]|nr:DNA translocase FtsK [Candidatus Liptonbacteria bacterium]
MSKKKYKENKIEEKENTKEEKEERLRPHVKESIWAVAYIGLGIILALAIFDIAGPAGELLKNGLTKLFGVGYYFLPIALFGLAAIFLSSRKKRLVGITSLGVALGVLSLLGLIEVFAPGRGGLLGLTFGSLKYIFGNVASAVINFSIFCIGMLVAMNLSLKFDWLKKEGGGEEEIEIPEEPEEESEGEGEEKKNEKRGGAEIEIKEAKSKFGVFTGKKFASPKVENYTLPPLSLLQSNVEKPTTGDLRANANIIKRTLESFGISVEMGEINIGPKVTRYTLKPAEGMKLSRITALGQDLSLALAAHPIRLEAPIPGKALVGIEVPNKTAALVRLGSLMGYKEFSQTGLLSFALGRDVTGEPIFADIAKMPHILVAGATGSGKSVVIHSILISLLFRHSPATLRLILVDPKRVELSSYAGIPHLISPVITENKKAMGVFRWALSEMDRRYEVLQKAGNRDIKSYNEAHKDEMLPNILIVIDELADLMSTYGREVEGSIVRLAQMARATGLHLILSTQRPSVEVITGLIKANIPTRIALQVASQIDSRTILDSAGAEKLLGGGDLLYTSAELSKPKRIQGSYVTEDEINKVADFIRENNDAELVVGESNLAIPGTTGEAGDAKDPFESYLEDDSDELYDEAVRVVSEAQKASASLLQRRLSVGYARAARLLDIMEAKGVIGPGDGAKPREVFLEKPVD